MKSVGVSAHNPSDADIKRIARSGISIVRTDLKWEETEKVQGKYDFSKYIKLSESLRAAHITPLYILDYGNRLYSNRDARSKVNGRNVQTDAPANPVARRAYVTWALSAAEALKAYNPIWEIWNEPDVDHFWWPKADSSAYSALATEACVELRANYPTAVIVGPAAATAPSAKFPRPQFLLDVIKRPLLDCLSGISVHSYYSEANIEETPRNWDRLREIVSSNSLHRRASQPLPVLSSEWGISLTQVDGDEARQASYLSKMLLLNFESKVAVSIWYDWRDDGTDKLEKEHHFGLLRYDGTEKPAIRALEAITSTLKGHAFLCRLSDDNYTILAFASLKDRQSIWITMWPRLGDVRSPPNLGYNFEEVVDVLGNRKSVGEGPALHLGTSPTFFRVSPREIDRVRQDCKK
ncbi:GH39 family glycosyl hydrolase [Caulobacter segnis]